MLGNKDDDNAFVFILKNTIDGKSDSKIKKKKVGTINCDPNCGPIFGSYSSDIFISSSSNRRISGYFSALSVIYEDFQCESKFQLFSNKKKTTENIRFDVLDYEVYAINNSNDEVYKACKYPDIIRNVIKTKELSIESLKQVNDETELLKDLKCIKCYDSEILMMISRYFLNNPSEFLPNSHIVSQQYDEYLRKWFGTYYGWMLIYRASEHDYTASSFHEYCDDRGPTLVVIKSSEGWIFGGYTTQSWSENGIYYDTATININR